LFSTGLTSLWMQMTFTKSLKLLPKKGDLCDPSKWRPIALLDVVSEIVRAIIAKMTGPITLN
jgi:hypothetical protein